MEHLAIDLGSRSSQICIRAQSGEILRESEWETRNLGAFLQSRPPSHVVLETSSEAFAVARTAKAAGHRVSVVPSTMSKMLGVGSRNIKTDVRDARALSLAACQLSELPDVHVPSKTASDLRSLNTSRQLLIRSRTQMVNRVRGHMRTELHERIRCTPRTITRRIREGAIIVPEHIGRILAVIDSLNEQIKEMEVELSRIAEQDATCRLLMTMPGVGTVTATRFVAALDTTERFSSAANVTCYLGLTAGERSSGQSKRRLGITKAGSASVRAALVQAAWSLWRTKPSHPIVLWAKQVAARRGNKIAITALARKMAGILFAMWRDGCPYRSERAARLPEST